MESPLRHQPGLIKLNHTIPAETAIKKAIGDLDMRPLGLDTVDLNNFRERMFNNLNQFPIFSKVTTSLTTSTEPPHGDNRAKDLGDWSVTMSKLMPELPKGHPCQPWNHGEEPRGQDETSTSQGWQDLHLPQEASGHCVVLLGTSENKL